MNREEQFNLRCDIRAAQWRGSMAATWKAVAPEVSYTTFRRYWKVLRGYGGREQ